MSAPKVLLFIAIAFAAAVCRGNAGEADRPAAAKTYAHAKKELIEMGICMACADNIAQYYARKPASPCAKLAKRALAGDSRAIDELTDFPDFCKWDYD